ADKTSPFAVLLAAFAAVLHKYSRQTDFGIGSPVANRSRSETERLIGLFVNTVVLRIRCDGGKAMRELVAGVTETTRRAQDHQDVPFEQVVDALKPPRDLSRNPLFQVMFAFVKPASRHEVPAAVRAMDVPTAVSRFDLTCTVHDRDSAFVVQLEYNVDLF